MLRVRSAIFTLGAAALLAAGCGHTSSSSDKTASKNPTGTAPSAHSVGSQQPTSHGVSLSRAEIITKADAICRRINAKRMLIKAKTGTELELALPQIIAYQRAMTTELNKLSPPAVMANAWNRMVADSQTIAETFVKLNAGAHANLPASASQPLWSTLSKSWEEMHSIARSNGITDCAHT